MRIAPVVKESLLRRGRIGLTLLHLALLHNRVQMVRLIGRLGQTNGITFTQMLAIDAPPCCTPEEQDRGGFGKGGRRWCMRDCLIIGGDNAWKEPALAQGKDAGLPPILFAAQHGSVEAITVLVDEFGIDLLADRAVVGGLNVAHFACTFGHSLLAAWAVNDRLLC